MRSRCPRLLLTSLYAVSLTTSDGASSLRGLARRMGTKNFSFVTSTSVTSYARGPRLTRQLTTQSGRRGKDDDKISRGKKKGDLPEKICVVCGRPFTWRKKWEKVWDEVKYCSDRCRSQRSKAVTVEQQSAREHPASGGLLSRRSIMSLTVATGALMGFALSGSSSKATAAAPQRPAPGEIESALEGIEWPPRPPFVKSDFARLDESDDFQFYDSPKFVEHIDGPAIQALEHFYASALEETSERMYGEQRNLDVLDLCSSWVSHLPTKYNERTSRIAGLGMNADELKRNTQLTQWVLTDLNKEPRLPYEDNSFDAVLCALSVDYLTRPISVMSEVARVLRPGGLVAIVFSNRLFFTKAVAVWTGKTDDEHAYTVGAYLHYGGGGRLSPPNARDISPSSKKGDPLYVVYAIKR